MKSIMFEMKILMDGIRGRLDIVDEKISEFEEQLQNLFKMKYVNKKN